MKLLINLSIHSFIVQFLFYNFWLLITVSVRQDGKKPSGSKHYTPYSGRVDCFPHFFCLFKANFDNPSLTDVPTLV